MEVIDKIAQEFDDWYNSVGVWLDASRQDLWIAWKVSRKALCVELPVIVSCTDSSCLLGYSNAVDDVKECLDSAGVSYK